MRRRLLLLLLLRLQVVVIGDVDARHGLASTALLLARLERRVKQQVVGRHLLIVGCRRFTALVHLLHRSTAHTHAHAISHTKSQRISKVNKRLWPSNVVQWHSSLHVLRIISLERKRTVGIPSAVQ